jgi:hypothetical protein
MYDATDPRAKLAATTAKPMSGPFDAASLGHYDREPPQQVEALFRTWLTRGQNFLIACSETRPGAVLARSAQPDEYMALLPDAATVVEVTTPAGTERIAGNSLVILPPGDSGLRMVNGGGLWRILTTASEDLAAACGNAAAYAAPHRHVAPAAPWPAPPGGFRVRAYSLDVPASPDRFGRIFRCTTLMVNCLYGWPGKRDPRRMSPHHHDDFEQGSLALEGGFTHHLRWPWTTDMTEWRADEHHECGSPSVCIIPPPAIHTTQAVGAGMNTLVDVFCPPRLDFSATPGWVLNAADYPAP